MLDVDSTMELTHNRQCCRNHRQRPSGLHKQRRSDRTQLYTVLSSCCGDGLFSVLPQADDTSWVVPLDHTQHSPAKWCQNSSQCFERGQGEIPVSWSPEQANGRHITAWLWRIWAQSIIITITSWNTICFVLNCIMSTKLKTHLP